MMRAIWLHALVLSLGGSLGFAQEEDRNSELVAAQLESQFRENVQPVLKRYCYRCHGAKKMKSGVRVDILDGSLEDKQLFLLKHVHKQLVDEAMPPEDERQPGMEERKMVTEWVAQALREGERKVRAKNGSMRRLTVAQYHNTLRDLLGVEDRLADALPADGISKEGFKNNANTLLLTPQMMESYFEIADKALDLCLVDETRKPQIQCFRVELGSGVNKNPTSDHVELEGPRILPQKDYWVREVLPDKPFPFEPLAMQKKFRFIEGYKGNATVRGWKDFEGLHHAVFAAIIGKYTGGYNYGRSAMFVPEGLLLRPRSPETDTVRGPAPTFSMPMRELPKSGMLQVTVEAARYDDGLQPHARAPESEDRLELDIPGGKEATLRIPAAGVYQFDVVLDGPPGDDVVTADIDKRTFSKRLKPPFPPPPGPDGKIVIPFLLARFAEGTSTIKVGCGDGRNLRQAWITAVAKDSSAGRQFAAFVKRAPNVSVHMGLRTDVGARLSRFDVPKPVPSATVERYSFRAPLSSFASPDTEENNENYLAGLREIAIRSEPTDDRQIPRVLVRAVEIEGPFYESWPPRGHREIFFPSSHKEDPPKYAREVIERFATRAFRRPPNESELESLLTVWRESYERSKDFQVSVRHVLVVVLTSPQFLYLTEESAGPQAEPLSPHELAAKLSYFLWNTTPDEQLRSLAGRGKLRAALPFEIDRLVADERFEQFADEFVSQWLSLDKFDVVNINHGKFPRLNRETKRELGKEPIHFVTHLIRANLPLRNLIDSDFIVANDVVAGYYGIGSRAEQGFAFAPVRHGSETLGGVLTQVAILSGLTDGHESNPVKRGAWLARKIIAEPPEPPPPNVPDLPNENEAKGKTLAERLEQHRNQEGCAQCHRKIDPWGLPLEQFDAGGLFKKEEVDARSTLPDKTEIADTKALKVYLADERIDQVAFSFLHHLASYATGRRLTFNEIEFLKKEGRKALAPEGYRMKDCVRFVIESPIFLEK
jgi:hypothetical protein